MNISRLFRSRDKSVKRLKDFAQVFASIESLIKADLIFWEKRNRRLLISAPLASLMMQRGADAWRAFLNNVFLYISYAHQQEQWTALIQRKQNSAVAEAKRQNPALSLMDADRIRRVTASNIDLTAVEIPSLAAFDFFIVEDTAETKAQTVIVGSYDPDAQSFHMVEWNELQKTMEEKSNK